MALRLLIACSLLLAAACARGGSGRTDGGGRDAGVDAGELDAGDRDGGVDAGDGDGGGPDAGPRTPRSIVFQSAGGGTASSGGHRLRLSIGAPQPAGDGASSERRLVIGPAAARP
jgi:hypothetical protein